MFKWIALASWIFLGILAWYTAPQDAAGLWQTLTHMEWINVAILILIGLCLYGFALDYKWVDSRWNIARWLDPRRLPIRFLRQEAEWQGWVIKENAGTLQNLIRQGASDGDITVWGRFHKFATKEHSMDEPLLKIPKEHWAEHEIEFLRLIFGGDDSITYTTNVNESENGPKWKESYNDLHVYRGQAARWLLRNWRKKGLKSDE